MQKYWHDTYGTVKRRLEWHNMGPVDYAQTFNYYSISQFFNFLLLLFLLCLLFSKFYLLFFIIDDIIIMIVTMSMKIYVEI